MLNKIWFYQRTFKPKAFFKLKSTSWCCFRINRNMNKNLLKSNGYCVWFYIFGSVFLFILVRSKRWFINFVPVTLFDITRSDYILLDAKYFSRRVYERDMTYVSLDVLSSKNTDFCIQRYRLCYLEHHVICEFNMTLQWSIVAMFPVTLFETIWRRQNNNL